MSRKTDQREKREQAPAPVQVRTSKETRRKLEEIASKSGLSLNDIASMAIHAGLTRVEEKLDEITQPATQAA